jgi:SpoVK/Ycf46/Vps4 family AAA+-type ATPase
LHPQRGKRADLRIALLLHGPRGSGKSTAVQAAAAALGVQVIPFSCHELKAQDGLTSSAAIKAAFDSACDFAPCILLLKQFEVFCSGLSDPSPHAGSMHAPAIAKP